jgi:hypothetical protein
MDGWMDGMDDSVSFDLAEVVGDRRLRRSTTSNQGAGKIGMLRTRGFENESIKPQLIMTGDSGISLFLRVRE